MNKIKSYWKSIIFTIAAAIMIAHGARMIYQGIFKPNSFYPAPTPYTVDFWFDWTVLLIVGLIVFILSVNTFYHKMINKKKDSNEKSIYFNPS